MTKYHCSFHECPLYEAKSFAGLSYDQICAIQMLVKRRQREAGEFLYHEGTPVADLFFVTQGYVKVATCLPDGREQILRLVGPGQTIGLETLSNAVAPYTAKALTRVMACAIHAQDMLRVLQDNPATSMRVIAFLSRELERAKTLIQGLGLMSATERVASFLLSLLAGGAPAGKRGLHLPLSRQEMGDMLGLSVETVSRQMTKLKQKAVIWEINNRIYLLDPEGLKKLAGLTR